MALAKCKECGTGISKNAKACPQCGAPNKKKVGILGWIFALVVVLPFAWSIGSNMGKTPAVTISPTTPSKTSPVAPAWTYGEIKDEMTAEPVRFARLESPDRASFEFPYNESGGSKLSLILRKGGREGEDIFFSISKGQIICSSIECSLNIKIADGPIRKVKAIDARAGVSDTIFMANPKDLKQTLLAGRPFKVEIEFYKAGRKTFNFDPKGLAFQ